MYSWTYLTTQTRIERMIIHATTVIVTVTTFAIETLANFKLKLR